MKINDENRILIARSTMDCFITDPAKEPTAHPSFCAFVKGLLENARADSGVNREIAIALWKLMLEGFQEVYRAPDPADVRYHTKFNEFAQKAARCKLLDTGGKPLALWSGGFDMSTIAQKMGYCTLETTVLGSLLDTTEITSLWHLEAKLWNAISKTFVESYNNNVVHVYFRTVDEASVLLRQEVPILKQKTPPAHIYWHPIYLNGLRSGNALDKYSEVGRNGLAINIDNKNAGIPNEEFAFTSLQEKLISMGLKDSLAINAAHHPSFKPRRAPFAFYE